MSVNEDGVVSSWLITVPGLKYVESRFDTDSGMEFLRTRWGISVIGSVLYLIFVFGGRKAMENRKAYSLRRPLILWNGGLAVFSILGSFSLVPSLLHGIYLYGVGYTICNGNVVNDPHQTLWGLLFILSKLVEFGDTAFIVLRKKPLLFLHWYHHITVCVYSFYLASGVSCDISRWFSSMNFFIHSVMYSYYVLRAAGFYVPSKVSQLITLMQLSQMLIGIYINVRAYMNYLDGRECGMKPEYFYFGMGIYGSYAILFLHFFLTRYIFVPSKQKDS